MIEIVTGFDKLRHLDWCKERVVQPLSSPPHGFQAYWTKPISGLWSPFDGVVRSPLPAPLPNAERVNGGRKGRRARRQDAADPAAFRTDLPC